MSGPGMREYAWATHRAQCERCRRVDFERPATVANACFEGSRLLKDALGADLEKALLLAIVNLRNWRLGALDALPSADLEALAGELATTLDYVGDLVARRRAAALKALH